MVRVPAPDLILSAVAVTKYKIVDVIKDKGTYTIVETKNGFGKLKSGAGWISLEHTKKVK